MDWIKIPTDSILYSEFKDSELIALIKYQALYCQLESQPTQEQMKRILNKRQLKFVQSYSEVVQELCKNQVLIVKQKRNRDKENYKQKQLLIKNSDSEKTSERELVSIADKIREDNIKEIYKESSADDKPKGKPVAEKKLKETDIVDWNTLFTYWEQNKKGSKYKDDESRGRMLKKLKELTNNNLPFAKEAIFFAIDNNYQGFCNGSELYYKGKTSNSFGNWDNF